jgi:hypothetical protein
VQKLWVIESFAGAILSSGVQAENAELLCATIGSIAWIDCIPKGAQLGRSLVSLGEHVTRHELRGRSAENPFPRSAIQSSKALHAD